MPSNVAVRRNSRRSTRPSFSCSTSLGRYACVLFRSLDIPVSSGSVRSAFVFLISSNLAPDQLFLEREGGQQLVSLFGDHDLLFQLDALKAVLRGNIAFAAQGHARLNDAGLPMGG